jgi:alpha-glucosidase
MQLVEAQDGFDLLVDDRLIVHHRTHAPAVFIGVGDASVQMNHGHFKIEDYVSERTPLAFAKVNRGEGVISISLSPREGAEAVIILSIDEGLERSDIRLAAREGVKVNRFWLRLVCEADEYVWGGGEQLSYFNLKGRRFPLWTSEPGVGRDPTTLQTFNANQRSGSGGDYWNTNYPQPTYISSRRYALHVETTAYSAFDFRHEAFHEIEVWEIPERIELWARPTFKGLVCALSDRFGRQPPLPDWVLNGAIIGLKDGDNSFARLKLYQDAGAAVAGLWCEDWVGLRVTSFGRRLFWDWAWNAERYPGLQLKIADLAKAGVRFLGYVNPYLAVDGALFPFARDAGYLALRKDADEPYIVDFGEFDCGVVDFTNSEAAAWFAEAVIGENMIDFGLSGWMADFGEYLPTDVRLKSGQDGMLAHNAWPVFWAKVNADAVASRGRTGEILFFMRAGFSGVQAYCPLLWAGDQAVDFSRHDGLQTVICAALSSGLLGNAYHHSDIGGYTSLFGNVRTAELLMRWAEMAAFTAVMRTHEGNRPTENLQIDQNPEVLAHFARMTRIYRVLKPYLWALSDEAVLTGLPLQRPLFLHFEDDRAIYDEETAYLLGPDLLVAPVIEAGAEERTVRLPAGARWTHLWSGEVMEGARRVDVAAPIGRPAVFYRHGSPYTDLFRSLPDA